MHVIISLALYTHRAHMSPENTHKPIRIYMGGLLLDISTMYMLFHIVLAVGKG